MAWQAPNPNPNPNQEDAPPQYTGHPFFDNFFQAMQDGPGAGVDHRGPPPFPGQFSWPDFAGAQRAGGYPRRGGRCRRGRRSAADMNETSASSAEDTPQEQGAQEKEKEATPDTMRDVEDPPEDYPRGPFGQGTHGPGPHCRGGPFPFWGPGAFGHGPHGPHGPHGHRGRHGPHRGPHHGPPPPAFPFDFGQLQSMVQPFAHQARAWADHIRRAAEASRSNPNADSDSFEPPVDVFNTPAAFVLHVALPGAKKEDVGVNWDAEKGELSIAGVVYRPGDEEFIRSMASSERKVGMFERTVSLPPAGSEKEEIDGLAISAKMEDGVLIVTVPKLEKEWTEVRKVDIE